MPVWVCALDGFITFAVCFETIVDMILLGKVMNRVQEHLIPPSTAAAEAVSIGHEA